MRSTMRWGWLAVGLGLGACGDDSGDPGSGGGGGGATSGTTASSAATTSTTGSTTATGAGTTTSASSSGEGGGTSSTSSSGGSSAGGGGASSTTGVGGYEAECEATPTDGVLDAAALAAEASCELYERCLPGIFLLLGGDVAVCAAGTAASLAALANVDARAYEACLLDLAEAYGAVPCGTSIGLSLPASCLAVGTLPRGAECDQALQCADGDVCVPGPGDCGVCSPLLRPGEVCEADEACGSLPCVEGICQAPQPDGTDCDSAFDCQGGACAQGSCATAVIAGEGDPCGGLMLCDPSELLLCDGDTNECVDNPPPAPGLLGEACVPFTVDLGGFAFGIDLCESGSACVDDVCVEASLAGGSCAEGQACVRSECIAGVCEPGDPNACACQR